MDSRPGGLPGDSADGALDPFPGVGMFVESGEMAGQWLSGIEPAGDVGIDLARDIADAHTSPADGHGPLVMRIVGLTHQPQLVTHAHVGLKVVPAVVVVTGDELTQQLVAGDGRA